MSARLVKKQLAAVSSDPQQPAGAPQGQPKLNKHRLKRKKAKQLKAVAENQKKQAVYGKNLAYFAATKGTQSATAQLMAKARVHPAVTA